MWGRKSKLAVSETVQPSPLKAAMRRMRSVHHDTGTPPEGYYLVGNLQTPPMGAYAMVLDGNGVPVWYYSVPTTNGVFDVASLTKGTVSFTPWTPSVDRGNLVSRSLTGASLTKPSSAVRGVKLLIGRLAGWLEMRPFPTSRVVELSDCARSGSSGDANGTPATGIPRT